MNLGQVLGDDPQMRRKLRKMEIAAEKQKKKKRDAERSRALNSGSIYIYRTDKP